MLGIALVMASTAAFTGAVVLLAVGARRNPGRSGVRLLSSTVGGKHGFAGEILNVTGWILEILGLARVSLTLTQVLSTTGQVMIVGLAGAVLHEPLRRRDILGAGAVIGGVTIVGLVPPTRSGSLPGVGRLLWLVVLLGPVALAPHGLRRAHRTASAALCAVGAGVAYGLSGMSTKGISDALVSHRWLPGVVALAGVVGFGFLASVSELEALQRGRAVTVVPLETALGTIIPIVCAPMLFGERWPAGASTQTLLAGGIVLTLIGGVVLARDAAPVVARSASVPLLDS